MYFFRISIKMHVCMCNTCMMHVCMCVNIGAHMSCTHVQVRGIALGWSLPTVMFDAGSFADDIRIRGKKECGTHENTHRHTHMHTRCLSHTECTSEMNPVRPVRTSQLSPCKLGPWRRDILLRVSMARDQSESPKSVH